MTARREVSGMYIPDQIHVLPPRPGVCRTCAARHRPEEPHDHRSLYYMVRFYQVNKRFPTPEDAEHK